MGAPDTVPAGKPATSADSASYSGRIAPVTLEQCGKQTSRVDGEPEQFRQLTDHHGQGNAVDIAVTHRLGEEVRDEAEFEKTRRDADEAGENREHPGKGDCSRWVSGGEWQHDRGDNSRQ